MRFSQLYIQAIVIGALWLPLSLSAHTMSPSRVQLSATGDGANTFFRFENKELKPAAVEITIHEHHKDLNGSSIVGKNAEDDFIIYPSQLILMPGDEVSVQLRWVGDPALDNERAFTLVAREVPIKFENNDENPSSGVNIQVTVLLNYEAKVYVAPKYAKPNIVVESFTERSVSTDKNKSNTSSEIDVIFLNRGNAHQSMKTKSLVLIPFDEDGTALNKNAVTLNANDIPNLRAHILAGERRMITIPRPSTIPRGPLEIILSD